MLSNTAARRVPFGGTSKPRSSALAGPGRPALFYVLFALLCTTNVVSAVGFLMNPDIAYLVSGQNEIVLQAYQDRISQLRVEVDRLHSRQYAQAGNINLQLLELAQQQETLTEQHEYVQLLAQKASELGLETAVLPGASEADTHPVAALSSDTPDILAVSREVERMMEETKLALSAIGSAADDSTNRIVAQLQTIGIRTDLPDEATGGPFESPDGGPDADSIVDEVNAAMDALTRFKAAQSAINLAPVHHPLATARRISSGYGNRTDPFTKGRAFHSGLDYPAPTGTAVLSPGLGTVTFVGERSGYGKVVEVDHGGGITTRYAHLSAYIVKAGQLVQTGTPIAKVGSTGRSTGPHLHFEVRKNDQTLDPRLFLDAGKRLERFLAA